MGGVSTYFDPDIVQGARGTEGGPQYFIYRFDESLNALCKSYANQYSVDVQNNWTFWSFDTLLAKAAEVLGLQSGEEIANTMRNHKRGFSTAAWGVQRATMLSLLTHFPIYNGTYNNHNCRYCHFYDKRRYGRVAIQNTTPQREDVEAAIAASSVNVEENDYGANYWFGNHAIWQTMTMNWWDPYCDIEKTEQLYLVPSTENMAILLDCDAIIRVTFDDSDDQDDNHYYFDTMGDNYSVGINLINTHIDSNGVFWNTERTSYPTEYPQRTIGYFPITVGYSSVGELFAIFGNKFNYQLVW